MSKLLKFFPTLLEIAGALDKVTDKKQSVATAPFVVIRPSFGDIKLRIEIARVL